MVGIAVVGIAGGVGKKRMGSGRSGLRRLGNGSGRRRRGGRGGGGGRKCSGDGSFWGVSLVCCLGGGREDDGLGSRREGMVW